MFDPEHKNIDCPECLQRKVYFDRKIGYYCMFCGYELSVEEALFLIEKMVSTSKPAPDSGKGVRTPIVEIKGQRGRPAQTKHISPGSDETQNKKSE